MKEFEKIQAGSVQVAPIPRKGTLIVFVEKPMEAKIMLDGKEGMKFPRGTRFRDLKPGAHKLVIEQKDQKKLLADITLKKDAGLRIFAKSAPGTGDLTAKVSIVEGPKMGKRPGMPGPMAKRLARGKGRQQGPRKAAPMPPRRATKKGK